MKNINIQIALLIVCIALFGIACRNTKQFGEKEYLLNKNIIKIDNKEVNTEDLTSYIKQNPNRKILQLFRFHLCVYTIANKGKETRTKKWLKNTIGETPVILDTFITNKSVKQIKLYLNNKGYFNAKVGKEINYNNEKHKANVTYIALTNKPYQVQNINYSIEDSDVRIFVLADTINSLIKLNKNYDVDQMQIERERITKNLKDNGYYNFAKEYIEYRVDSSLKCNKINLTIHINNCKTKIKMATKDTMIIENHKRYRINKVFIYPEFKTLQLDTLHYDTIKITIQPRKKTGTPYNYYFVIRKDIKNKVKFKTLARLVFIEPKKYFNITDVEKTYNRISEQRFYKFTNILFSNSSDLLYTDGIYWLDCKIQLTRTPIQSLNYELEGTNSSGNLGVAGNIIFQNKNLFHGIEMFNVKIKGALEVQKTLGRTDENNNVIAFLPFNTVETGIETGLDIPKFFVPIRAERFPKYFNPKTTIIIRANYQRRPDYTRYITNMTFGYDWKENIYKRHILNPIEISSVKIKLDSLFEKTISVLSEKLQSGYKDHLIAAMKYTFLYNNQQTNKSKKIILFKGTFEMAGNLLYGISKTFNFPKSEEGYYNIFNIHYAQYLRADADFRHFNNINQTNTFAYRTVIGIGLPYSNLPVLPFEKSFYVGGANDIRAWQIRTLGPGAFNDTLISVLDKTGDIMIEGNLEYRFGIYKYLQGATFVDAGNVWLMHANAKFKEGEFLFNKFYKQIAVGAGIGIRFDFSFFIFRIDAAVPLKDPAMQERKRWIVRKLKAQDINFNLGIGYPF